MNTNAARVIAKPVIRTHDVIAVKLALGQGSPTVGAAISEGNDLAILLAIHHDRMIEKDTAHGNAREVLCKTCNPPAILSVIALRSKGVDGHEANPSKLCNSSRSRRFGRWRGHKRSC